MKISTFHSGLFKLDGGAMFGVVPKTLWHRLNEPDEKNLCTWAMRSILIETGNRKILVDTGIGNKQDDKFRSHFEPHGPYSVDQSLVDHGLTHEDITDVFITHLHFDHVGGAVSRNAKDQLVASFPNATYWSNEKHYNWAIDPNPREKASFLKENFVPLKNMGQLKFIDVEPGVEWLPGIKVDFVYGHTEAMMILYIKVKNKTLVYCADLIPSSGHVGLPYVMAYDVRPLHTMEEKGQLLEQAVENDYILFFEHDRNKECGTLKKDDRGRIVLDKTMSLKEALG